MAEWMVKLALLAAVMAAEFFFLHTGLLSMLLLLVFVGVLLWGPEGPSDG